MPRPIPPRFPPDLDRSRRAGFVRPDTEPSPPPVDLSEAAPGAPPQLARATDPPRNRAALDPPRFVATGSARTRPPTRPPRAAPAAPQRPGKLPFARQEIVGAIDEQSHAPDQLPRATADLAGPPEHLAGRDAARTESAQLPAVDLDLASSRLRVRGTPRAIVPPSEQIRTLVFAPEPARAAWIERELSHAPITIQVGRSIRTIVAALLRDPPPRPDTLVVDFDAISEQDLRELHAVRRDGWFGRLVGLGTVPDALRASLGVDHVLAELIRDSLLDCVAGTRHAVVTTACPVIPRPDEPS